MLSYKYLPIGLTRSLKYGQTIAMKLSCFFFFPSISEKWDVNSGIWLFLSSYVCLSTHVKWHVGFFTWDMQCRKESTRKHQDTKRKENNKIRHNRIQVVTIVEHWVTSIPQERAIHLLPKYFWTSKHSFSPFRYSNFETIFCLNVKI